MSGVRDPDPDLCDRHRESGEGRAMSRDLDRALPICRRAPRCSGSRHNYRLWRNRELMLSDCKQRGSAVRRLILSGDPESEI